MNYILFDDATRYSLLPFTHTRPIADIRCGILTMRERWEEQLQAATSTLTESYLQPVYPLHAGGDNLVINASIFATSELKEALTQLSEGEKLMQGDLLIAARFSNAELHFHNLDVHVNSLTSKAYTGAIQLLKNIWDIFSLNEEAIKADFILITKGKKSAQIPEDIIVKGKDNLFIEEGAAIGAGTIINATTGPVYIGKEAEIMEGAVIRGPFALGEHGVVKMGAKIYGATTIGPGCKVGGEVSNVVFFANSNKGHDGFLGNAVIGEWCNLGADTNCSNLKNNYDEVKIWDEHSNKSVRTGLQFCGLIMGDHSKCGINTMFNTGTVVGVSANIFGGDFPEKFIPSFCWGGSEGFVTYDFNRAIDTARRMMKRRGKDITETEIAMYRHISDNTNSLRNIFAAKKN
jgi:UDP-N-acetylglucosamine diphosphorylase/glucosamine-1-phosphate N-acetyltransferase